MYRALTSRLGQVITQKSVKNLAPIRCMGLYEPDYLDKLRPQVPVYENLNIEMTGYDYPVLESYQRLVHEICETMEMSVSDCWALPAKEETITRFKANSSTVDSSYLLKTYKRIVQVEQVKAHQVPLLTRIIQAGLPEGVKVNIMEHTELHDKERYVPDQELIELKQELTDIGGPVIKKDKRRR
ncbi:large ribosomal subunit protein mL48 [Culicoides brevitarsis]|uniref:large ribosomal subunit protein mL48 n=1 Tax=Culicoides brevitarsis TaxID=469753 RepID=UPI00307BA58F